MTLTPIGKQAALKYDGGTVLAGITLNPVFHAVAASSSAPLTGATVRVYSTIGATTANVPFDTEIAGNGLSMDVTVDLTFVDNLPAGTKVVLTCDINQGATDQVSCEVSFQVTARKALPPT
jgi:hypothetical protein